MIVDLYWHKVWCMLQHFRLRSASRVHMSVQHRQWNWRSSSKSRCYESSNFTLQMSCRVAGTVIHNCDTLLINIVSLLHVLVLALRLVSNQIDTQTYILLTTIRNNACTNNSKVVESYQKEKLLKQYRKQYRQTNRHIDRSLVTFAIYRFSNTYSRFSRITMLPDTTIVSYLSQAF